MGIHTLPELRHYWSNDNLLGVPAVANLITKTRFKKLTENIHCNDNTKAEHGTIQGPFIDEAVHADETSQPWCLADSRTGFVRQFDIYSGRSDTHGVFFVFSWCEGGAEPV